jgi:hypothetical protein
MLAFDALFGMEQVVETHAHPITRSKHARHRPISARMGGSVDGLWRRWRPRLIENLRLWVVQAERVVPSVHHIYVVVESSPSGDRLTVTEPSSFGLAVTLLTLYES